MGAGRAERSRSADQPILSPGARSTIKIVVFANLHERPRLPVGGGPNHRDPTLDAETFLSGAQAGRLAALLYLGSSAAEIASLPFPQGAGANRTQLLLLALAGLAIGGGCWLAPWSRWPRSATLALVPPAFALIALGNAFSGSIPFTYSVFFVVVFVWIGVSHRQGVAAAMSPLAVLAYVLPLPLLTDDPAAGIASAILVVPTCVLVGESLAWASVRFRRSQAALLHTEERFRLLVEGIDDYAIVMLDPEGLVVSWNAGAGRISGYQADEIIGRHFSAFHTMADVRQGKPARLLAAASDLDHADDEGWRVRKDGSRYFAHVLLTALRDPDGSLRGFAKITRDVTQRRQADEALRQSDDDRRHLLSSLVRAQEEERHRVAADIHDDTVQVMSAVAMRLDLLHQQVTEPDQQRIVRDSAAVVHASIERLRRLIFALRPAPLDEEGLAAAVAAFVAEEEMVEGRPVIRVENLLLEELPLDIRILAYRIVQESLINVFKHADASKVDIRLEPAPGGVAIRVRDDGRGFPMNGARSSGTGHIGLATMREHAHMAGGRCVVRSAPGSGTTVDAWLPLESGSPAQAEHFRDFAS
jgi:PAS domain S-box-containing protein